MKVKDKLFILKCDFKLMEQEIKNINDIMLKKIKHNKNLEILE